MDEGFDVSAGNDLVARRSGEQRLLGFFVAELSLFALFSADCLAGGVQRCVEIVDQAFLTHVMNDLARRVVRAETFAQIFLDQVFENLAEHLRDRSRLPSPAARLRSR